MNKITYFILSYIVGILSILLLLFCTENFWGWLLFVIVILTLPLVLCKILKSAAISKEKQALFFQCLIFCIVLSSAYRTVFLCDNQYMVAFTKSQTKANEIQELLTTETRQTQRRIVINDNDKSKNILISVKDSNKKDNYKVTLELLNSDILDDNADLCINAKYTKNPKKMLKRVKKECENILYGIDGMSAVSVEFELPSDFDSKNPKIESINVSFETKKTIDNKKIKNLVEKFINSSFRATGAKITINDLTYSNEAFKIASRAKEEFKKGNYTSSLKLFNEANNFQELKSCTGVLNDIFNSYLAFLYCRA